MIRYKMSDELAGKISASMSICLKTADECIESMEGCIMQSYTFSDESFVEYAKAFDDLATTNMKTWDRYHKMLLEN